MSWLQGEWKGIGTIVNLSKRYNEKFTCKILRQDPVIIMHVAQFTSDADTGAPLHAETGFVKILPEKEGIQKVEMIMSHPFSVNEMANGTLRDGVIEVVANQDNFQRGITAKGRQATYVKRVYKINEKNELCYKLYLGVNGEEPYEHLDATLGKV